MTEADIDMGMPVQYPTKDERRDSDLFLRREPGQ